MKTTTKRMAAMLGLVGVAVAGAPAVASAGSATLYELTENMKVVQRQHRNGSAVGRRVAASAITGFASPGTPLCPIPEFQTDLPGDAVGCMVNVLGHDNVSLETGLGTLQGDFTTVIQGDNPVDGPEAVVLRGEFSGHMNFSPAILHQIPYGTVSGKVKARGRRSDFTGVFRLPFAGNVEVEVAPGVKMTLRQVFCPLSPKPNPNADLLYGGIDLAYMDFDASQKPNGQCLNIRPDELSLGAPLVRFDIDF
jgi:hypothetical protein